MPKDFKNYASQVLALIYEHSDYERVHDLLKHRDRKFAGINVDAFGNEYLAGRLALACTLWERCCVENRIPEEETQKALMRRVMQGFESPKFLKLASVFSEYLHDAGLEENPVLGVVEKLFHRLAANAKVRKVTGPAVADAFQMMIAISESFKNSFENEFFTFVHI